LGVGPFDWHSASARLDLYKRGEPINKHSLNIGSLSTTNKTLKQQRIELVQRIKQGVKLTSSSNNDMSPPTIDKNLNGNTNVPVNSNDSQEYKKTRRGTRKKKNSFRRKQDKIILQYTGKCQ
jgi:hypothetical protein